MKREKGQKRRKGLFAQDFLALTAASPGQDAQELEQTSAAQTLKKKILKVFTSCLCCQLLSAPENVFITLQSTILRDLSTL